MYVCMYVCTMYVSEVAATCEVRKAESMFTG